MAKSKSKKNKLLKAVEDIEKFVSKMEKAKETISNFSEASSENDLTDSKVQQILNISDTYRIKNNGEQLTFNLIYKTEGVGAVSDGVLESINPPSVKQIVTKEKDSIINKLIAVDTEANRKFLNIKSLITATNLTPVPADFKAEFSISGGEEVKEFPVPEASFKEVGDQIILDISIFFF